MSLPKQKTEISFRHYGGSGPLSIYWHKGPYGDAKAEIYAKAELIVKVKEPLPDEYDLLKENLILYTYLHLAAEPKLTRVLCERKVKAVAKDKAFYKGLNVYGGSVCYEPVAKDLGLEYKPYKLRIKFMVIGRQSLC